MAGFVPHGEPLPRARATLVVVHGRGQTPGDMVAMVTGRLSLPGVAVLLPEAAGKSWYRARAVDPLTAETESSVLAGCAQVGAAVAAAAGPVLLAGFSQGACIAAEYVLRGGAGVAALAALTGCRVGTAGTAGPRADLAGMPVLLTGSDADPWIPVAAFAEAVAEFALARARLRAEVIPDRPHSVADAEIAALQAMIERLLSQGGAP